MRRCQMVAMMLVVLSMLVLLPPDVVATTEVQETPLALPVVELTQPTTVSQGEIWKEDEHEILIRNERGTKADGADRNKTQCRYTKDPWSECDLKINMRTRTLILKKGGKECDQRRIIQKKCKKACRYEKGHWSECIATGQMTRTDKLKLTSNSSCESTRTVMKKCKLQKSKDKINKDQRKTKDKGVHKGRV